MVLFSCKQSERNRKKNIVNMTMCEPSIKSVDNRDPKKHPLLLITTKEPFQKLYLAVLVIYNFCLSGVASLRELPQGRRDGRNKFKDVMTSFASRGLPHCGPEQPRM